MENHLENKNDWRSNVLWWSVTGVAAGVFCFSLFEVFTFTFTKTAILAVAIFVAVLVAKYHFRIPRTESVFYPKTVFAFWGTAWLGLFGGVLLAAAASAADHGPMRKHPWKWLRGVAADVLSAFFSATVFHVSLGYFSGPEPTVVAGRFFIPNEVIFASCLMAIAYFATSTTIDLLSWKLDGKQADRKMFDRIIAAPSTGHSVSLAVSICLFLTFNHFGIEFGLVIVPLAIAANILYRIHVRSLEQKTKEITEASRIHLATVEALATAIDARDQVGIGHVRRTQIYAVGIGKLMDLPESEIDALRTGALLHDIGKLAIPDHILNKPGSLTPGEMEKTKTHSSVGASILEKVGFTTPVVPAVKYHHEFWDGTGYPEGLRGSQIPLPARILSIADSYDTLRGARPYRPAVSHDDACNFLRAGAGSQFDPKVVDLFLRNLKTFQEEIEAEGLSYEFESNLMKHVGSSPNFVEQIKRANREVFTLYSLARDFSAALNLEETLSLFADKVGEFVPYDSCAVYLLDDTGEFATAVHVVGEDSAFLSGKRIKVGEGATGYVLKKHKPVENVDPALDFAFSPSEDSHKFKTMVSRPLMADERLVGAISLYSSEIDHYQDEHFRLLETVSRIAADAIAKSQQHAEAASHALTDPITALPNARCLQVEFDKEVKRSVRSDTTFQVLMLDLDGFKAVNDTFGHKVGDNLLTAIGGVIRSQLRDYDFLARYAGDEFVALIPDTDSEGVQELCSRIEKAVSEFGIIVSSEAVARVGISVGAACYPSQGESFDQLIISADKAMYLAKAMHKQKNKHFEELVNPKKKAAEYVPKGKGAGRNARKRNRGNTSVEFPSGEMLVVELDETHIISSASVN
jgi:diguanylate cyclase (GGDEF)-like protein/putative nucleotidyltransferase with HDIG domain